MRVYIVCEQPLFSLAVSMLIRELSVNVNVTEISAIDEFVTHREGGAATMICCGRSAEPAKVDQIIHHPNYHCTAVVLFTEFFGKEQRRLLNERVDLILPMSVSVEKAREYLYDLLFEADFETFRLAATDPALITKFLPDKNDLTSAERGVLSFLCKGMSDADIAMKLCIRVNTVKVHLARARIKMGAPNRTAAATLFGSMLAAS